MSNDQRPARLRLVSDGGKKDRRSRARTVPVTIEGAARPTSQAEAERDAAPRAVTSARRPVLAILLFLLACVVGGTGVVLVRIGVIG